MMEEDNCRRFLELALDIPIGRVEVSREKSLVYHPEYKGVRLDVFARGEDASCFNVEMQVAAKPSLGKRSRYYHAHMDMELLLSGREYRELPNTCVIFICDFDPFGQGKFRYTFRNCCRENSTVDLKDGRLTMFLSTHGKNPQEISEGLVSFLNFVKAALDESGNVFRDPYIKQLQNSIRKIKKSREMGDRYMIFREMLQEEWSEGRLEGRRVGRKEGRRIGRKEGRRVGRKEGRKEGQLETLRKSIFDLLSLLSPVPDTVKESLFSINDPAVLDKLLMKAAKAESLETFLSEAKPLLFPAPKSKAD